MDAQDKKELQVYVSRKPAPSMMFSLVIHAFMILFMLLYGLDTPELLKPIIIEMGGQREDDLIVMDDEPHANQEILDWMAEMKAKQDAEVLAKTKLEPDFKPADISPISDPIFNPEPQKGSMSVTEVNPVDLLSSIATDRMGSNSDSENMGNPLAGTQMEGGSGGDGEVGGMLQKLNGLGAKRGKITVSLFWNTTDDLDLHLVKATSLPVKGKWFLGMCCFQNKKTEFGHLDIDMNVQPHTNDAVENIYLENFVPGRYGVYVHFYRNHTRIPNVKYTLLFQEEGQKPKVFHGSVNFIKNNYSSKRVHTFWIKHDKSSLLEPQPEPEPEPEPSEVLSSPFTGI